MMLSYPLIFNLLTFLTGLLIIINKKYIPRPKKILQSVYSLVFIRFIIAKPRDLTSRGKRNSP